MRELESTPPSHLRSQNAADRAVTPAKRTLCSAAVNAAHAPAKRLHTMHAPEPTGQLWQQQRMVQESEYGVEGSDHEAFVSVDTQQLPFSTLPASGVNRPCPPRHLGSRHQQNMGSTDPDMAGGNGNLGTGRATTGILNVARPAAQRHSVRKEPSKAGTVAGLQLRTPLRPNSAGSALRGYVPPEHRFDSHISDLVEAIPHWISCRVMWFLFSDMLTDSDMGVTSTSAC